MSQLLQKKPADGLEGLSGAEQAERLRFALLGSGVISFDWSIADDRIVWDGALDILPYRSDPQRMARGSAFAGWLNTESRARLMQIVESRVAQDTQFELVIEASSALGAVWLTLLGQRVARPDGRAERLCGMMRVTTEHQREMQRLSYLATRDELTGHLNRNSLRAELAQAIDSARAEDRHCAFLVASIDRLAMINDGYGIDAGDEVIVAVGERLAHALRASDIIGRTAGNKFGVILKNCAEHEIAMVADRLRADVRDHIIDTHCGQVPATISVGAVWLPTNAVSSQEAMLRAEESLDRARSMGRDGFFTYQKSPQREGARLRLMAIADDVVSALNEDRLVLAYQPIIRARERTVFKYESLLRMRRKDGSVATAGQFVPAAEQMGIIGLVDRRALEIAVATLERNPEVRLGVNVSGTAATNPVWLNSFVDYVRDHAEVAQRLNVELTETAALHNFEESAQFISRLQELGCTVAIDDFGAGYTSFRNLRMLRIDTVKIDGGYVKGLSASPENQVFVRTLVALAKNFNIKVVAEWVESEEDAQLLETMGVDYFQGFFFGEPEIEPGWLER